MEFLKKLFGSKRPATQSAPAKRQPVKSMTPVEAILAETDATRRQALLNDLRDEAALEQLLRADNKALRTEVQTVWLERLLSGGALPTGASDDTLLRIASLTQDATLSAEAVSRIGSEEKRAELARTHAVARVRQAAAATLTSEALLQAVHDAAQGRDKAVFRLCKDRLAELRAAEDAQNAIRERIEYIRSHAAQLIRLGMGPDYVGRLQVLEQRWDTLQNELNGEDASDVPGLLQQAAAILTSHREAETRAATLAAELAEDKAAQSSVLSRLQSMLDEAHDPDADAWREALLSEEHAWANATARHSASAADQKQYDTLVHNITDVLTTVTWWAAQEDKSVFDTQEQAAEALQHVRWPESVATPDWLQALRRTAGQKPVKVKAAATVADDSAAIAQLEALMSDMDKALTDGQASDAARVMRRIQSTLDGLAPARQHRFQAAVRLLANRLNELRDWQGFAVNPKKESLCEQMEALVNAAIAPDALSDRIKALQEEWKTLGHSNDKDLWERFRKAADAAFEPCKAWFAEQAEERARLLTLREQLISELNHYESAMDWANADWKAVQSTLNAARDTFRDYSPVERGAHQRTQKAFQDVCDRIYGHLKAEYDRNLERKQAIVNAAEALLTSDDIHAAADRIKQLQQDWKNIGSTPRGPDQRLWSQLRKAADGVFARLSEQRDARKAEIDATVTEAEAAVNAVVAAAGEDGADVRIAEVRAQINDMTLPKGAQQRLLKTLSDLDKSLQDKANAQARAAARQEWDALLTMLRSGTAVADVDANALPGSVARFWNQNAGQTTGDARELCIAMEILKGKDSPAEDQKRRMELQVQRLAQGLGKGLSNDDEAAILICQWFTVAADASAVERERFTSALESA